ncbi:MAG: glycoside hydrolase family 78 protein [Anaerolineae bacterium]|nr:glycoside hydrolase family 78 protein [Anaerolineae bacterium]
MNWTAQWIGADEAAEMAAGARPVYWLRHEFALSEVTSAKRIVLFASARGLIEIFINGQRVGDAELMPGFTQYHSRIQYVEFDVTDLLREGQNAIALLLADGWFRGKVGMPRASDQWGKHTSAVVQIERETRDGGRETVVVSNENWRYATSHIVAADLIDGQREDRRLWNAAILQAGFADAHWAQAKIYAAPAAQLVACIAPPVRRVEFIRPKAITQPKPGVVVVDLGQNINGWVRLSNLGPRDTHLTLTHGEWLDADGDVTTDHLAPNIPILPAPLPAGQVDTVISAGAADDYFEPRFTTHGFQYVRIEGHPGELSQDDLLGVAVHSDLRRTGWFRCSDEKINRLHDAAVWSLRGNICDIPTDCPQRERSGWTGDWQLFAPTAAFLYDVDTFTRKWLADVMLDQRADGMAAGMIANMSPLNAFEGFDGILKHVHGSAGWGDVIVMAPWALYEAYGDSAALAETWDAMLRWVDFGLRRAASGRSEARQRANPQPLPHEQYIWDTGFHWGEWLEPGVDLRDFGAFIRSDKSDVATAYLQRSVAHLAKIAQVLGKPTDTIAHYARLADALKAAWQREFIAPDGNLTVQTQGCHVRALAFDLVPPEFRATVAAALVRLIRAAGTRLGTGFLSTPYLLPVLADTGHLDVAYELLLQTEAPSWLYMIERGATTVWERWEGVDAQGVPHESLSHYSKGAVISFLHHYTAGLRATAPGYAQFVLQPRIGGGLTSAELKLDTPHGTIEVAWRIEAGHFYLDLTVPLGVSGTVILPNNAVYEVQSGQYEWSVPVP